MTTETNKAAVRRFHECFDAGDWAGIEKLMSRDVKAYNNGAEGVLDFAAFKAMGQSVMAGFSQSRMVFAQQVAEGDSVATRMMWTAIHSGTFNGIPPTGRPARMEESTFDVIKNGKIIEHHALFDAMGLLTQIGAIPVPA